VASIRDTPAGWAAYMRQWRRKNPERARAIARRCFNKHRGEYTAKGHIYKLKYNHKRRADIIAFFGGQCARCGETDFRVLQMDHIHGGGAAERRAGKMTLQQRWRFITDHPDAARQKFQLLCANCNCIKQWDEHEYGPGRTDRKSVV